MSQYRSEREAETEAALRREVERRTSGQAERTERFLTNLLHEDVEAYLLSRHTAVWGRNFDIIGTDGRERAVNFIADLIVDINRFRIARARQTLAEHKQRLAEEARALS